MSNESTHVSPYICCFICGSEIGTYCYLMIYQVSLFLSPIDSVDGPSLRARKSSTEQLETSRCRIHDSSKFSSFLNIIFGNYIPRETRSIFEHSRTANRRAVEYTLCTTNGRRAYLCTKCECGVFTAPLFGSIQFITETTHEKKYIQIAAYEEIYIQLRCARPYTTLSTPSSSCRTVSTRTHSIHSEWKNCFVLCVIVLDVSTGASRRLTRIEIAAEPNRKNCVSKHTTKFCAERSEN